MSQSASSSNLGASLISEAYRRLNTELHRFDPSYGTTGRRYVDMVRQLARKHRATHILDYGCGKGDLTRLLSDEFDIRSFDPAIQEFAEPPEPADVVACLDVLEHVEPDCLDSVLADLARVTPKIGLFTIATRPANKCLADGTNCHRIVEKPEWWLERLRRHFHISAIDVSQNGNGLQVIVEPLPKSS